jgi:hypothetical protein
MTIDPSNLKSSRIWTFEWSMIFSENQYPSPDQALGQAFSGSCSDVLIDRRFPALVLAAPKIARLRTRLFGVGRSLTKMIILNYERDQ